MRLLPTPPAKIVSGSIRFDGRELTTLGERALEDVRGREIAMVFQDPMTALNPTLTIGTQIVEVLERHLGLDGEAARLRAAELLDEVGIARARERLDDYPHRFSGGMRQRVVIAMAIACEPRLLIADEPTTALDVTVQAQVLDLLDDLRRTRQMAMILITHNMGVVAESADEVAVMYAGEIVERAAARELFNRPEHPYTEALLAALPDLDDRAARERRLAAIPGRPPDLIDPPAGCRFAARCPYADCGDDCAATPQALRELRPDHWVRTAHPAADRANEAITP
jgi:oligopeptide/dipeptide ABC transporter ATP-binding protein